MEIFFITSSVNRNYTELIDSVSRLKKENFKFKIIITGRANYFNSSLIPKDILDNFQFKIKVIYSELYQIVERADFIIITLDPQNKFHNPFRISRVTGSIQLSYGFLKPCLINKKFASFYNLNDKNSIIFNSYDLYSSMKRAILLDGQEYRKLQNNLNITVNKIQNISIHNIKKVVTEL